MKISVTLLIQYNKKLTLDTLTNKVTMIHSRINPIQEDENLIEEIVLERIYR